MLNAALWILTLSFTRRLPRKGIYVAGFWIGDPRWPIPRDIAM
jgi:hypothetical protein